MEEFIRDYYLCLILAILGIIGYISYLKQKNRELYSQLSDKNDKYNLLYSEHRKLQDEKLKNKLSSLSDNQEAGKIEKHNKCQVCDSAENVKYFASSGYVENENGKTYLSGGVYICEECLSICEKCEKCGKLKMSMVIEPLFGFMKCDFFCNCPETDEDKELRYKREARRYDILQGKKRLEKLKEKYGYKNG